MFRSLLPLKSRWRSGPSHSTREVRSGEPGKDLDSTFQGLEQVILGAAMGTAKFALRLQRSTDRHAEVKATVQEALSASKSLAETASDSAQSARQSAGIARSMAELTAEGQGFGQESAASSRELCEHTRQTAVRLEALMDRIQEVSRVTEVIGEIANRTNLLALNAAIEAAHAREMGKGFAVVAEEVRKLAANTSSQTSEVTKLVNEVLQAFDPVRAAMEKSLSMAGYAMERTGLVGQRLESLLDLAKNTSEISDTIAQAMTSQAASTVSLHQSSQRSAQAIEILREDILGFSKEALEISSVVEGGLHFISRHPTGSFFLRTLENARELSRRTEDIFSRLVDEGRCKLQDLLALEYSEIRGADIQKLSRLFDVSRVPPAGFNPPKYQTAYDALVDQAFLTLFDEILARERNYSYALAIDLNVYVATHNSKYMKDWTGDPAKDAVGNRSKRLFGDIPVLLNGARVGLGEGVAGLGQGATREAFLRAGCRLTETAGARDEFLVQTYARDTGTASICLSVPIFVLGQRWGVAIIGWEEAEKQGPLQ